MPVVFIAVNILNGITALEMFDGGDAMNTIHSQ